ncbi:acyltransferase family protein [Micromonospora auratinigra]|uniref:Peptidoglycan/LPS O-acetylase OafA/YrhL, contains acyltransferase and SGNH-hydrolase domains n=1 Tax=Micromonospora auratinigra TaxID=261654 RepID=A0A1A8ZFV4_9ACTN|nr:acyltransferase [Micromonospora auratinigra]SBT42757.1 Peptidoglycan/LPS O-acetylase OafA/YrhL, contains acyltransferase and SGNH-hydrolase domains [Micromonospora auratinigra]
MTSTVPDEEVTSGNRLHTLTGLRFLAALLVFANHVNLERMHDSDQANNIFLWLFSSVGELGVGLFFILSGFVLTWSARPADTRARFWRRRFVRIYPSHFVGWALGLVLMLVAGEAVNAWNVVPSALLVHAWIPRLDALHGTNGPSWSLACELLFYLAFPWLLPLVRRIRPQRLWRWAIGLMAGIVAVPFVGQFLPEHPHVRDLPVSLWQLWFTAFLPPVRLLDFVLGIVLARIVLSGRWVRVRLAPALGILFVAVLVSLFLPLPFNLMAPFVLPLVLVLGAGATVDVTGRRSLFNTRALVWLGDISYAFYILHSLVIHYGHLALGGGRWSAPVTFGVQAGMLAVTIGLSALLYHGVERPLMRRFSSPPGDRPATPPDAPPTGVDAAVAAAEPVR